MAHVTQYRRRLFRIALNLDNDNAVRILSRGTLHRDAGGEQDGCDETDAADGSLMEHLGFLSQGLVLRDRRSRLFGFLLLMRQADVSQLDSIDRKNDLVAVIQWHGNPLSLY